MDCILPIGGDFEQNFSKVMQAVMEDGNECVYIIRHFFEGENSMKGTVMAVGHTNGIQVVNVYDNRKDDTIIGPFYPVGKPLDSVPSRRGQCIFSETQSDLEAYATLKGPELTFSVANYPAVKESDTYRNKGEFDVDIVGFCYSCQKIDENTPRDIRIIDMNDEKWAGKFSEKERKDFARDLNMEDVGRIFLDLTYFKMFRQENEKYPDDFFFSSPVYELDELEVFGLPMYRMKILSNGSFMSINKDEYITVFAQKMMFPDGLQVGDHIKGTGWLQGIFR